MKTLISVVGPTAIGKTRLAIALAQHFKTEIVSADSRQFFKEMNIGTAVPSPEELASAKHHFIQHRSILEPYSVGDFERDAIQLLDSLFQKLKVKPNNTKKVDDLISLYKKTVYSKKPNEQIIDEAIAIAEKIYYIDGLANCYNRKGLNARHENDFTASISHHKRALNLLSQSTDTLLKIKCLNSLGVAYRKLNLEKEAFDVYFEALDLSERFKNSKSIAIALNGIGNVFIDTKEYDKALYYFRRDYQIELNRNNTRGQEYCLSNIGEIFLYKKRYDSAYIYLNNALSLTKKHKRKDSEAIQYNLLGLLFQNKKEYSKSTEYYQKAIPILTNANNLRYLSNTLINIGVNQLYSGKTIDAFELKCSKVLFIKPKPK